MPDTVLPEVHAGAVFSRQRVDRLRTKTQKPTSRGRKTSKRPGVGAKVKAPATRTGKAVVKAKYMSPGRTSGYAAYMTKDKAEGKAVENASEYMQSHGGEGPTGTAELFTKAGKAVDLQAFIAASHHDRRVWTLILSPKHGNDLDMQRFTQDFMAQVEADTGLQLDYISVVHTNTPTRHSHTLLRGRDLDGQEFRLDPEYLKHGMRHRAIELQEHALSRGLVKSSSFETMSAALDATLSRLRGVTAGKVKNLNQSKGMEW